MRKKIGRLLFLGFAVALAAGSSAVAAPGLCQNVCIHGTAQLSTLCTCSMSGQVIRCGSYWLGTCSIPP